MEDSRAPLQSEETNRNKLLVVEFIHKLLVLIVIAVVIDNQPF